MSSSTSNFKRGISVKCLAVTTAVVLGYQGLISAGKIPAGQGINQGQRNKIKLTRIAFDKKVAPEVIFVGSSRMASIEVEAVSPSYYNMGMYGDSSHTGLIVCDLLARKPKIVVVEMSANFEQGVNQELLDKVFTQPWNSAFDSLSFSRPEYQPINVVMSLIRKKRGKEPVKLAQESLRSGIIATFMKTLEKPMTVKEKEFFIAEVNASQVIIDRLRQAGVRVILMKMPQEPITETTPVLKEEFRILDQKFPMDKYEWFIDISTPWRTNDGMHLIEEDGQRLTKNLANYLEANP